MTAGHCTKGVNTMVITAGVHSRRDAEEGGHQTTAPTRIFTHEGFDGTISLDDDIGIIFLDYPFTFNGIES